MNGPPSKCSHSARKVYIGCNQLQFRLRYTILSAFSFTNHMCRITKMNINLNSENEADL